MKLNILVNSGAAYIISLVAVIVFGIFIRASFEGFWIAIASLYGWHTGRRLWRQLKIGTLEVEDEDEECEPK